MLTLTLTLTLPYPYPYPNPARLLRTDRELAAARLVAAPHTDIEHGHEHEQLGQLEGRVEVSPPPHAPRGLAHEEGRGGEDADEQEGAGRHAAEDCGRRGGDLEQVQP